MNILNRLERKCGRYAIPELMMYVAGINLLIYLLAYAYPQSNVTGVLAFDPGLIIRGEVWRLVTFIFIPPSASVLWIFFILYFYYVVGTGLEHEWGSFRFNLYYFTGVAGTAAAAFLTGQGATALYLNLSLFLAFAYIYPNYEVLVFFVLPVKVKYLVWINWAFVVLTLLASPLPDKIAAAASVANYFLFFGRDMFYRARNRGSAFQRRRSFNSSLREVSTIHRCTVCGQTEKDDPRMDFRYCSACEGDYEYCMNHLKSHDHVRAEESKEKGDI